MVRATGFQDPPFAVQRFTPGTDQLTDLTPAVTNATQFQAFELGRGARWCVLQGGTVAYYQPTSTGVDVVSLPFRSCPDKTVEKPGTSIFLGAGATGGSATFLRGGVMRTIASDEPVSQFRVFGDDVIAVVGVGAADKVWAIWPDNTVELLASDLSHVSVSVGGGTVHVLGVKVTSPSAGPLIARRYRQGVAPQEVQLLAGATTDEELAIVTSAEGAAIASTQFNAWIAPSGSFVFTPSTTLKRVGGGVRGTNTVVFSGVPPDGNIGTLPGAVFAYDEVSGQPRMTRLTVDSTGFDATLIDPLGTQPSQFFAFGPSCSIGRIQVVGGIPTLEKFSCSANFRKFALVGVTAAGEVVIGDTVYTTNISELLLLGTTVRRISANGAVYPILDRTTNPAVLAGWVQTDDFQSLFCVNETPARCWKVPGNVSLLDARIEGGPIAVSALLFDRVGDTIRFTVARSIGPGDSL
ncbi:MAG TPA: hypothetical protein VL326_08475 [Kofleriaceae bacterium]|nr:hypothetical protein [Kofleriaceae bacterium]